MSVSHYDCKCCAATGVYEEYVAYCDGCRNRICYSCLLGTDEDDGGYYVHSYTDEDGDLKPEHCPICSGAQITDKQRVAFLKTKLPWTDAAIDEEILRRRKQVKEETG